MVSRTRTANDEAAELPAASSAVHVTAVEPTANVVPDAGAHETETPPSTMSVAAAENDTTAPLEPVASAVIPPGVLMIGAVVSRTVIVNDELAELPVASWAEHVTRVEPTPNAFPEVGEQDTDTGPSTRSAAVGVV